jgi:hypothetical protein
MHEASYLLTEVNTKHKIKDTQSKLSTYTNQHKTQT